MLRPKPRFYYPQDSLPCPGSLPYLCAFGCSVLSLLFDHLVLHHHRFQWIHREESLGKGLPEHSPRVGSVPRSIFEVQSRITTCQVTWREPFVHVCALTSSFADSIICLTSVVCRVKFTRKLYQRIADRVFWSRFTFFDFDRLKSVLCSSSLITSFQSSIARSHTRSVNSARCLSETMSHFKIPFWHASERCLSTSNF